MRFLVANLYCLNCQVRMKPYDSRKRAPRRTPYNEQEEELDSHGRAVGKCRVERYRCPHCGCTITVPNSRAAMHHLYSPAEIEAIVEPDLCDAAEGFSVSDPRTQKGLKAEYEQLKTDCIDTLSSIMDVPEKNAEEALWEFVGRGVTGWYSVLQLLFVLISTIFCEPVILLCRIMTQVCGEDAEGAEDGRERPG